MTIMQIINMIIVADGGVAATRSMCVISVGMSVCAFDVLTPDYGGFQT